MSIGENIMKYWKYYAVVTAMVSVGAWLHTKGGEDKAVENRLFSNKEIRYETEKWMENKPTELEEQKARILDSMANVETIKNNISARKSRAKRDSTLVEEIKARKVTDSINRLNADQLYQIKEEFQEIKDLIKEINNE